MTCLVNCRRIEGSRLNRIVVLTRCYPAPFSSAVYGVFQRLRVLLEAAAGVSTSLKIVFLVDKVASGNTSSDEVTRELERHWGIRASVATYFYPDSNPTNWSTYVLPVFGITRHPDFLPTSGSSLVAEVLNAIEPDTELVLVHRLHAAMALGLSSLLRQPLVMDLDDVEHKKFLRELRLPPFWPGKYLKYLQLPALLLGEIGVIRRCADTFVCSDLDRRYLQRLLPSANIGVVPNSVRFPPSIVRPQGDSLLFLGTYTYGPNVDAAEYLVNDIFPLIRALWPSVELVIAGNKVERLPSFPVPRPGVRFMGFVPDVAELYRAAAVVCCPIRSGGGTRIKIIEAAAYGLPVVSSTVGAEGLSLVDGRDILIRDKPREIAEACVKLLADRELASSIGQRAREAVACYERDAIIAQVSERLIAAASARRRTSRRNDSGSAARNVGPE